MKFLMDLLSLFIKYLGTLMEVVCEVNDLRGLEVLFEFKRIPSSFLLFHALYRLEILIFKAFHFLEKSFDHPLFLHIFLIVKVS